MSLSSVFAVALACLLIGFLSGIKIAENGRFDIVRGTGSSAVKIDKRTGRAWMLYSVSPPEWKEIVESK